MGGVMVGDSEWELGRAEFNIPVGCVTFPYAHISLVDTLGQLPPPPAMGEIVELASREINFYSQKNINAIFTRKKNYSMQSKTIFVFK